MPFLAAAAPFISAAVGAGTAIYSAKQQSKAADKAVQTQQQIRDSIKYEPIDLEALKKSATEQAIANATQSLALERQLTPDIASARETYSREVRQDLEKGGALPADVVNQVTSAGRVIGSTSGIGSSSTVPLTAALLGISSMDLRNQRLNRARDLTANTELPLAGLDPGTLATLEVQQNAAMNDFNAAKAGIDSNLAESTAIARGAQIAGQTGSVSAIGNLIGQGLDTYLKRRASSSVLPTTGLNQNPSLNPIMGTGTLMA